MKQSFPTVCLLYLSQGDSVSQEQVRLHSERSLIWAIGTFYIRCCCSSFGLWCLRLAAERLGRATGGRPPGLCPWCGNELPGLPQGPQPTLTWPWLIRATRLCTFLHLSNKHSPKLNLHTGFCTSTCSRSNILCGQPLGMHCLSKVHMNNSGLLGCCPHSGPSVLVCSQGGVCVCSIAFSPGVRVPTGNQALP